MYNFTLLYGRIYMYTVIKTHQKLLLTKLCVTGCHRMLCLKQYTIICFEVPPF